MCEIAGDLLLGMMGREGSEEADVTKLSDSKHLMERGTLCGCVVVPGLHCS